MFWLVNMQALEEVNDADRAKYNVDTLKFQNYDAKREYIRFCVPQLIFKNYKNFTLKEEKEGECYIYKYKLDEVDTFVITIQDIANSISITLSLYNNNFNIYELINVIKNIQKIFGGQNDFFCLNNNIDIYIYFLSSAIKVDKRLLSLLNIKDISISLLKDLDHIDDLPEKIQAKCFNCGVISAEYAMRIVERCPPKFYLSTTISDNKINISKKHLNEMMLHLNVQDGNKITILYDENDIKHEVIDNVNININQYMVKLKTRDNNFMYITIDANKKDKLILGTMKKNSLGKWMVNSVIFFLCFLCAIIYFKLFEEFDDEHKIIQEDLTLEELTESLYDKNDDIKIKENIIEKDS